MSPTARNYDSTATLDSDCVYNIVGCTDSEARNYAPIANTDDGGCVFRLEGCMAPVALNFDSNANVNGPCRFPVNGPHPA